ncbi:MAG: SAM-dependent methyltransferase [Pseudomonadota bacterium]
MPEIYLAGLGIRSVAQVTRETEAALRLCREILFLDTGLATEAWLSSLGPQVTALYGESYAETGARRSAYHHMAARVVAAALDHPPVAFAVHGHPIVGVMAPQLIAHAARPLGLEVEVLPAVSTLDCLFADLLFDPVAEGLQMFEATDMLLRRRPVQTDLALILWQVGTVESCLHTQNAPRPERFLRLRDYLLQFYPRDHPATAVFASPHPLLPAETDTFPLQALSDMAERLHPGITLFIGPVGRRPVTDTALLALLENVEHLRRITHRAPER